MAGIISKITGILGISRERHARIQRRRTAWVSSLEDDSITISEEARHLADHNQDDPAAEKRNRP